MTVQGAEQSVTERPGSSPESGSHTDVMSHVFDDEGKSAPEEAAPETPEPKDKAQPADKKAEEHDTQPKPEEKKKPDDKPAEGKKPEKPAEDGKPLEYTEETYRDAYGKVLKTQEKLDKALEDIDVQKKGMEKHFTEQSEKFKALREEAGIQDRHEEDKGVRKAAKKAGDKPAATFGMKDFFHPERLKQLHDNGIIDANGLKLLKTIGQPLNLMLNNIRQENHEIAAALDSELRGEFQPIQERLETATKMGELGKKWATQVKAYKEKYGDYTPDQMQALENELRKKGGRFFNMIDDASEEEVEVAIRRVIHDPGVERASAFHDLPPPKKEPESELEPEPESTRLPTPGKVKATDTRRSSQTLLDDTMNSIFD